MIITKMQGGLGNQMFQYAVARSMCRDKKIYIDISFLKNNKFSTENFTTRNFELRIFNLPFREFSQRQRNIFFDKSLKYRIARKFWYGETIWLRQKENEPIIIPSVKNIYFDGYFQSEKYFKNIRSLLLEEFTFPTLDKENIKIAKEIESTNNSVSIHVRRGDYLKPEILKYHGIISNDYYKSAIILLETKYSELSYFIFSDDISFAQTLFQNLKNVFFVNVNFGENSWKDMKLMSICKHHIIANSSFSWWGAWLSQKEGMNIAPENWFNKDVVNFNIEDIIPKKWCKI